MAALSIVEYEARSVFRNDWRIEEDDFDIGITPEDDSGLLHSYAPKLFGASFLYLFHLIDHEVIALSFH